MDKTITKPRQLAAKMIDDFIAGGQVQINPDDYPREIRTIAITEARNAAAIIVFHARKARTDRDYRTMLQDLATGKRKGNFNELARLALRYNETRSRRGAA